jgi:hypothetical protein
MSLRILLIYLNKGWKILLLHPRFEIYLAPLEGHCRLSIYLWFYGPCGPWPLFQCLNPYTVGRTPWTGDQPVARPLPTDRTTQTQNKRIQTSMPRVGFETTIPVFERPKTVHALDCAATVVGHCWLCLLSFFRSKSLLYRLQCN